MDKTQSRYLANVRAPHMAQTHNILIRHSDLAEDDDGHYQKAQSHDASLAAYVLDRSAL